MTALFDAALGYARRRRPVFPTWPLTDDGCACGKPNCDRPGKHPIGLVAPRGFKDATTDVQTVRRWWARWPDAGIGTPTGPNWFALDVDKEAALVQLVAEHGPLPPTVEVVTPRPGRHLYLLGSASNSDTALPDGLNVRGLGGYVLLPPSPHENGVYEWRTAPDEAPIARAPAWLLELLASPGNGAGRGEHQARGRLVPHGQRDPYLKDFGIRLLRGGFIDRALIASHLEHEFRRVCAPLPAPRPGYFERMAGSLLRTRIADRERDRVEFAARWARPAGGDG